MHSAASTAFAGDKYLAVLLEDESYGIPVMTVREIIPLQRPIPVPNLPACCKGAIDLRGRIIPLIDLRVRLGLKASFDAHTCIVVVQVATPDRFLPLGLIVSGVAEVATAEPLQFAESSDDDGEFACLHRVVARRGRLKAVLDIDRIASPALLESVVEAAS